MWREHQGQEKLELILGDKQKEIPLQPSPLKFQH
ncbi:hypothetical protein SLEP1_g56478 [Rubroshorea leprosula]|uniref:Uncharacterized protein n=1 Tax=Rubroshorea leprosula TaxID=152421 RepID=A0AAV5MJS1_9ROSI|nr:hypothetical protein SLEP1_g56478 [Rubroshorea leprosula]